MDCSCGPTPSTGYPPISFCNFHPFFSFLPNVFFVRRKGLFPVDSTALLRCAVLPRDFPKNFLDSHSPSVFFYLPVARGPGCAGRPGFYLFFFFHFKLAFSWSDTFFLFLIVLPFGRDLFTPPCHNKSFFVQTPPPFYVPPKPPDFSGPFKIFPRSGPPKFSAPSPPPPPLPRLPPLFFF